MRCFPLLAHVPATRSSGGCRIPAKAKHGHFALGPSSILSASALRRNCNCPSAYTPVTVFPGHGSSRKSPDPIRPHRAGLIAMEIVGGVTPCTCLPLQTGDLGCAKHRPPAGGSAV